MTLSFPISTPEPLTPPILDSVHLWYVADLLTKNVSNFESAREVLEDEKDCQVINYIFSCLFRKQQLNISELTTLAEKYPPYLTFNILKDVSEHVSTEKEAHDFFDKCLPFPNIIHWIRAAERGQAYAVNWIVQNNTLTTAQRKKLCQAAIQGGFSTIFHSLWDGKRKNFFARKAMKNPDILESILQDGNIGLNARQISKCRDQDIANTWNFLAPRTISFIVKTSRFKNHPLSLRHKMRVKFPKEKAPNLRKI